VILSRGEDKLGASGSAQAGVSAWVLGPALVLGAVLSFSVYLPARRTLHEGGVRMEQLQRWAAGPWPSAEDHREVEARLLHREVRRARLESRNPSLAELPHLMQALASLSRSTGFELDHLTPDQPRDQDPDQRTFRLHLIGSFLGFNAFLDGLGDLPWLLVPQGFSVEGEGAVSIQLVLGTHLHSGTRFNPMEGGSDALLNQAFEDPTNDGGSDTNSRSRVRSPLQTDPFEPMARATPRRALTGLVLHGVIVDSNPSRSIALLRWPDERQVFSARVGEQVGEGRLLEVHTESVDFAVPGPMGPEFLRIPRWSGSHD
jgi:hypothetical protein